MNLRTGSGDSAADPPHTDGGRRAPYSLERAHIAAILILAALTALTVILPDLYRPGPERLTYLLAINQDVPLVPALLLLLLLTMRWNGRRAGGAFVAEPWMAPALIAMVLLIGWIGHFVVFDGNDLSRDEQMATFDTIIFAHGKLFWKLPEQWRLFADSLNLRFILPIGDREYWVSGYLPVNAAFRALLSLVGGATLASPLMAALAGFCIWRVARLLWPTSTTSPLVALLLFATSTQVLVTAMTAFALTMHVALNMLWLLLFLMNRRRTHAAAVVVGWLATGIHQPLFHPLFVLPFFVLLLFQKRWRLLAFYLCAYALIAAFWLAWPLWISAHGTTPAVPISETSGIGYVARLQAVFKGFDFNAAWTMSANLLRFVCWQNPVLFPLIILGVAASFRLDPICRALAVGLVLPIIVMALLLPWQGHAWGYRYLHPFIGNAVLLAGYGWRVLEQRGVKFGRALGAVSAFSLIIILPVHSVMAHHVAAPFIALHGQLISAPTDIVIVDTEAALYGEDIVFNRPDLANRPTLLIARFIRPEDISRLCRLGSVGFFPAPRMMPLVRAFRTRPPAGPTRHYDSLVAAARAGGCRLKQL